MEWCCEVFQIKKKGEILQQQKKFFKLAEVAGINLHFALHNLLLLIFWKFGKNVCYIWMET